VNREPRVRYSIIGYVILNKKFGIFICPNMCLPHVGYEVYHHPPFSLIGLHSIACKCKLINFNHHNFRVNKISAFFVAMHCFVPPSRRRNFVVCSHEPLLTLGVLWNTAAHHTSVPSGDATISVPLPTHLPHDKTLLT
jgi:hypothetical protein